MLSEEHQNLILQAIQDAELQTSGEIRVHVESHCAGHPIDRAKELFFQLGMQKTAYEIGVRLVGSEMCIRDSQRRAW